MIPVFGNAELAKADLVEVPHVVYFMKLPTPLSPKPGGSRALQRRNKQPNPCVKVAIALHKRNIGSQYIGIINK
jgi:hypothetical protein